jgi:hypothetical protein
LEPKQRQRSPPGGLGPRARGARPGQTPVLVVAEPAGAHPGLLGHQASGINYLRLSWGPEPQASEARGDLDLK